MSRVIENTVNFRRHINRAIVRPDPYGLPGWITNSDQLSRRLYDNFSSQFREYIEEAFEVNAENGCFICYDQKDDSLKLGSLVWGEENIVLIRDCVGYRPIGSFHTHVHTDSHELAFSPPDIKSGLGEFALVVGGAFSLEQKSRRVMAVLSPYNYWKLPREQQNEVDYLLTSATLMIYQANAIARKRPADWIRQIEELELESKQNMRRIFDILNMVYVGL